MIIHDVEQGTPEWFAARLGIPTASEFSKIYTPTGKVSTQAKGYMNKLLAEIITGEPVQTFEKTPWMERGNELEQEAADFYEFLKDTEVSKIGFCTNDAREYGCSPDRLIGETGGLEIKVVAPHTMASYLLSSEIDMDYWPQVQGNMLVTGRDWWDWMAYCPKMPPLIIRVGRADEYIAGLTERLKTFNYDLFMAKDALRSKGYL
jgi:hypothetical protein